MGFEANRQQVFSKRIVDLPDQPDMSARDLKAYFDSSAEELRQSFNGLCDALIDFSAAAKMGYRESAGVPAQTVQSAIENVQKQVRDASVGKLPSGCVDGDKLAQDVRDRFTAIENSVQTEAATRSNMDATLQQRLEQAGQVLTCKAEILHRITSAMVRSTVKSSLAIVQRLYCCSERAITPVTVTQCTAVWQPMALRLCTVNALRWASPMKALRSCITPAVP